VLKKLLRVTESINIKHVILIESLLVAAIFVWRVIEVGYNVGVYDTLINTNFIGTSLLIFVSSVLLFSAVLKGLSKGALLVFFILYFLLSFLAPYIANFPHYFHRDVYLHLPHSLAIVRMGYIPLYADRWDISSFPGAFLLYSIIMEVTGMDSVNVVGVLMAVNYSIVLIIIIMFFVNVVHKTWRIDKNFILMMMVLLLPFIARYAPRPEFPFRFHLAFIQTLLYLALFIALTRSSNTRISTVVCLTLIYMSIVFTHPFFSLYIFIASLTYLTILYVLIPFNIMAPRTRSAITLTIVSVIIVLLVHISYVVATPFLRETYRLMLRYEEIPKFFESSIPISIESQDIAIQSFATIIRFLWRVTVFMIVSYVTILVLMALIQRRIPILGISLGIVAFITTIPLILSFLWLGRSLTFVGIALIIAGYETLHILSERSLSRNLLTILVKILPIITALSIMTSSLITWEGPRFVDEWHGVENEIFLKTVAYKVSSPYTYLGVYSNIEFTYHKILNNVITLNKNIFDHIRHVFYENLCNLSYPYAVSQKDPDYRFLDIKELSNCRDIVWSSGISYIFR
jgi:hypothetical protein